MERGEVAIELVADRGQAHVVAGDRGLRPPHSLEHAAQLGDRLALARLVRVQLEAEVAEAGAGEPALHHLERGLLLGDEQHALAGDQRLGDQVGDRLRLAGAGRALQHERPTVGGGQDRGELARVAVERREQLGQRQRAIERRGLGKRRLRRERVAGAGREVRDHRRAEQRVAVLGQIGPHRELGEREDAEARLGQDLPAIEPGDRRGQRAHRRRQVELVAIGVGARHHQAELGRQLLEQRVVPPRLGVGRRGHAIALAGAGAAQLDGIERQRRVARDAVAVGLEPAQDAEREPQRAGPALLRALTRAARHRHQPPIELVAAHRRDQLVPGERLGAGARHGLGRTLGAAHRRRIDRRAGREVEAATTGELGHERHRIGADQRHHLAAVARVEQAIAQRQIQQRQLPAFEAAGDVGRGHGGNVRPGVADASTAGPSSCGAIPGAAPRRATMRA